MQSSKTERMGEVGSSTARTVETALTATAGWLEAMEVMGAMEHSVVEMAVTVGILTND